MTKEQEKLLTEKFIRPMVRKVLNEQRLNESNIILKTILNRIPRIKKSLDELYLSKFQGVEKDELVKFNELLRKLEIFIQVMNVQE